MTDSIDPAGIVVIVFAVGLAAYLGYITYTDNKRYEGNMFAQQADWQVGQGLAGRGSKGITFQATIRDR
jgi:hypothetical protein